mgnify:CR=1 FL=1
MQSKKILRHCDSQYDWRKRLGDRSMYSYYKVPPDVDLKCAHYLEIFGLDSGVFDFAVNTSGEYVFFECNANGQWLGDDLELGGISPKALHPTWSK